MKGIDSNVLIRLLVGDDPDQAKRARDYIAMNAPCWINRIALCEAVWVLERLYGHSRPKIASALRQVMAARQFVIEDKDAVQTGIDALERGFDFADCVIAATNQRAGCETTATFDRKAARLDGFEAL